MIDALIIMYAALATLSLVAGLFFLRYWRLTRDRFFVWFATAFWTFAVNWVVLAHDVEVSAHSPLGFAIRLAGFLQILTGILLKNRPSA